MLKEVVLGEINGKNAAINAYDGIIWKIRSGYLTIVFAGWAILMQSIAEGSLSSDQSMLVVVSMLLVSLVLSLGGATIDRNYVRRKFRVIIALDELMEAIKKGDGDPALVPVELLKNAGDDGKRAFDCRGYRVAQQAGYVIYWVPPILFAAIAYLVTNFLASSV